MPSLNLFILSLLASMTASGAFSSCEAAAIKPLAYEPICGQKGIPLDADFMDVHFPVLYTLYSLSRHPQTKILPTLLLCLVQDQNVTYPYVTYRHSKSGQKCKVCPRQRFPVRDQ